VRKKQDSEALLAVFLRAFITYSCDVFTSIKLDFFYEGKLINNAVGTWTNEQRTVVRTFFGVAPAFKQYRYIEIYSMYKIYIQNCIRNSDLRFSGLCSPVENVSVERNWFGIATWVLTFEDTVLLISVFHASYIQTPSFCDDDDDDDSSFLQRESSPPFNEPEGSLLCSLEPTAVSHPLLGDCIPHPPTRSHHNIDLASMSTSF
jgi:hypothetical protein